MNSPLLLIALIAVLIWFWLASARARELAVSVVDELCRRRGFQLLDQTVALSRLGLARTDAGLRMRRVYRFDYSIEGTGRRQGHILLVGGRPVNVDMEEPQDESPQPASDEPKPGNEKGDDNVVPFRRRH